jgi:hypothetical protein
LDHDCTNNQTEYQALLFGLEILHDIGVKHVEAYGDSLLVVQQVSKVCQCLNGFLLTDKRRNHLRSASVRTYTFFTTGFPRFLSICGARGLQAFDLPLLTNYSNPNYD